MTKLAQLISRMEGYGKPGAIPTTHNNPGDLRHSPHSAHSSTDPDGIGQIDTPADGWEDLERELRLYAERGYSLATAINMWAPTADGNNATAYLTFVCDGLGMPPETPVSEALKEEA